MNLLILLLSTTLALIFLFILHKYGEKLFRKVHHLHRPPPGPHGLPLIGNLHQFDNSAPHIYLWRLSKKYGPLMSLKLGSLPILVVSSAKMAKEVMKNHDHVFCSRPPMVGQRKLSYDGLDIAFAPYNKEWREMRKICVLQLLSAKRIRSFRAIREHEVSRMIQKISQEAASSKVTNLSEVIMCCTSIIICRIGFGKRCDEEDHQMSRYKQLLHDAQAAFVAFYFSDFFPKIGWLDHLVGSFSRLDKIFHEFDSFYQELIDEHMDPNRPNSMDGDIVDLMLQLSRGNSADTSFDITIEHVKAMLMNVFFAGSETSAAAVVWTMTALLKSPKIMEKAQAEIRQTIGKQKCAIDEDDLGKLPYLKAIVKEALRLYPPGPLLIPRYTMEECIIDGYEIRPNTTVYLNAWAIGRDPEYWENPDEFMPERFLDGKNVIVEGKGQEFQFIAFGAGRRGCPGYSMAFFTVELALANLLHSFDWELPSGMKKEDIDDEVLPGLTMLKKNDLHLVAKRTVA